MRDTAERLAAELAAAKRHIVTVEETIDRLKAGAFPPAVRATPSSDAMRARDIVANAARTARAAAFAARHRPRIAELRGRGEALTEVARRLNAAGIPGPSGGLWSAQAVRRVERSG